MVSEILLQLTVLSSSSASSSSNSNFLNLNLFLLLDFEERLFFILFDESFNEFGELFVSYDFETGKVKDKSANIGHS